MNGPEFHFLKSIDILSGLEDKPIQFLAGKMRKKSFKKGEYVFFQGEDVSQFYFLEMGRVEIYKSDIDGRKLTLWFIEPKGGFCLANLHIPSAFANAFVVEDAMAYTIRKKDLNDFVAGYSDVGMRFVHCMSKKMASYSELLEDMSFKDVTARLSKVLLQCSILDEKSGFYVCPLSQGQLAALVGSCREVIARSIKKMRGMGIISTSLDKSHKIVINNPERLKLFSD